MPARDDADSEALWQSTYDERAKAYESHFGPMPEYVHKMMNLTGVWPGGCLVQLAAPKLFTGAFVSSSFGLTNPDMPARAKAEQVEGTAKTVTGEIVRQMQLRLTPREPRKVPEGLAGYGYEIIVITPAAEKWPLQFLNWIVPLEINEDIDLLDRVNDPETGGVTVEDVAISKDASVDLLIEPAAGTLAQTKLATGTMNLLVATRITKDEMRWALANGRRQLAEKLAAAGVGQTSTLTRGSVLV